MKIGVVIVTFNRLEKLKKCMESYERQTYPPNFIVVINNASTDGTKDFLDKWIRQPSLYSKKVIDSHTNLGGAGGFKTGVDYALQLESDWIWLSDDDAYPNERCFEELADYYNSLNSSEREKIVALCGRVNDNAGLSSLHRRRVNKGSLQIKEIPVELNEYEKREFDIDIFSFVGSAVKTITIKQIGLPREDFFIYFDDTEYSMRIGKVGQIKCVPNAVVTHDSPESVISIYSWKNYYMFRNKLYTYGMYYSKKYQWTEIFKNIYMIFKYYNTKKTWIQWICAMHDCKKGILGKCEKYLPK